MNDSYKKRLYTQALSLSAAVLMAVLAQGKAAAGRQYRLYVRACRAQGYRPRTGLSGRQADLDSGQ